MADSELHSSLERFCSGDAKAGEQVIALAYPELKRMARLAMARERPNHTLQPTALVNEVWLKLMGGQGLYASRAQFFGLAARAMREILVDYARKRLTEKRNGGVSPLSLEETQPFTGALPVSTLLALDQSIDQLAAFDARKARVVEMRFFAGMSDEEIATVLAVSERTVKRDWIFAKAYLHQTVYGE